MGERRYPSHRPQPDVTDWRLLLVCELAVYAVWSPCTPVQQVCRLTRQHLHCPQPLREVYDALHTRRYWCTGRAEHTRGEWPRRSDQSLSGRIAGCARCVGECAHQLYRCREGCRRAACGRVDAARVLPPWGGKEAANPSDRTGVRVCCGGGGGCGDRSVRREDRPW